MSLLLDVEMAAVHAGVSVRTIRRWIHDDHLTPVSQRPTKVHPDDVTATLETMRANQRASLFAKPAV